MRDAALLGTRLVLGSYLAVHGAQKLFGTFGGPGLEKAGAGFHHIGLRPGSIHFQEDIIVSILCI